MITTLSHLDCQIFKAINSHHTPLFDVVFSIITNLGNGWYVTPLLILVAFVKIPKQKLGIFILMATLGMIASGVLNSHIKKAVHSPRPLVYFEEKPSAHPGLQEDVYKVHIVGEPLMHNSFPSGHTNTAFSAAALLAFSFGGLFWLTFIPAVLVGYSRMYMGVHFPLDVVCGGVLGIIILAITVFVYKRIVANKKLKIN